MPNPNTRIHKGISLVGAVVCAIASVIDRDNPMFLPIGVFNLFNYLFLWYLESEYEKAKKKKKEQDTKNLNPDD